MKIWQKMMLVTITLSLLFISCRLGIMACSSSNVTVDEGIEEARAKLKEAYNATAYAEMLGANVDEAVEKLNIALEYITQAENLVDQGDLDQVASLTQASIQTSEEIIAKAQELKVQQGLFNFYTKLVLPVVAAVILLGVSVYAFFFGRRVWKKRQQKKFMEMKVKRSNETMTSPSKDTNSHQDVDEEKMIVAAVLSALIVIAGLLVYVSMTPAPQEGFVSIYILNSENKAYNYPELLILGKNNTFSLSVGVEDGMNRIEYCIVQVKIANASQPEETLSSFERILLNGETWEIPLTMTLNKTGKYSMTSELWLYDEMRAIFNLNSLSRLQLEVISET